MQTNFDKVKDFTLAAGQPVSDAPCVPSANLVGLRLNLITEELLELHQAVLTNGSEKLELVEQLLNSVKHIASTLDHKEIEINTSEIPDALGDILYVTYGAGLTFGYDLDDYFADIHESNMSKFAPSMEEANETIRLYSSGQHPDKIGHIITGLHVREVKPGSVYAIMNTSTGKVLKYHKYLTVQDIRTAKGKTTQKAYLV